MACRIFLSYRRSDSQEATHWLYEKLKEKYGVNDLFMDREDNPPGTHWEEKIKEKVREADIMLVVIGKDWLSATDEETGKPRLSQRNDWVRKEIEMALLEEKRVMTLLLKDAILPKPEELPASVRPLTAINYHPMEIGSPSDLQSLLADLDTALDQIKNFDPLREMLLKVIPEKYKLEGFIAEGRRSKVYKARDTALDRWVAVKVLKEREDSQAFIESLREAATMDDLVPHCVHLYGAWIDKNPVFAVTNYMEEGTLREFIDRQQGRPFALKSVLIILKRIGGILSQAHELGHTHGNIKPSNILLNKQGDAFLSTVSRRKNGPATDLEDSEEGNLYNESIEMEDHGYLPPEIMDTSLLVSQWEMMKRVDQYMLGLIGYELLTGFRPEPLIAGAIAESLNLPPREEHASISEQRKDCPGQLEEIIQKMTAYDPDDRYESLREAMEALGRVSVDALEVAKESYTRCIAHAGEMDVFFKAFYQELIRLSPVAAESLGAKGIGSRKKHKQYALLGEAIFMLLMFSEQTPREDELNILSRIAEKHDRDHLKIPKEAYDDFKQALLNTVGGNPPHVEEAMDPDCQGSDTMRRQILKAWDKALEPGLQFMKQSY